MIHTHLWNSDTLVRDSVILTNIQSPPSWAKGRYYGREQRDFGRGFANNVHSRALFGFVTSSMSLEGQTLSNAPKNPCKRGESDISGSYYVPRSGRFDVGSIPNGAG